MSGPSTPPQREPKPGECWRHRSLPRVHVRLKEKATNEAKVNGVTNTGTLVRLRVSEFRELYEPCPEHSPRRQRRHP
jgi:hypothetical protein